MKVLVGMSGGVDSSVSALFLKQQGYDVKGVTFRLYTKCENSCCSDQAVNDAKSVCKKLEIEHFTQDYTEDFQKKVVDDFIDKYVHGVTPNPCVTCNKYIKFNHMLDLADENNIEFVSSGHYANIEKIDGFYVLVQGEDENKDQSYFLYPIDEKWLPRILFPLGKLKKPFVREKAAKYGLDSVKDKKDSFDICFIPDSYKEFLNKEVGENKGDVIFYPENKKIGEHKGIYNYTIGQSRGLNISWSHRLYVRSLDYDNNAVIVSKEEDIYSKRFTMKDCNFFSYFLNKHSEDNVYSVKIRHYAKKINARVLNLDKDKKTAEIEFVEPVKAVTPGQSAVLYSDNILMFGGIIDTTDING